MSKIIGISGVAGSGKDTFFELLKEQLSGDVKRFALADNLKLECNDFFIKQYGIDIFHCTREQKELLRPILVAHGKMKRLASEGQHWTSILKEQIHSFKKFAPNCYIVITDIRYDVYDKDEVYWLKDVMGGKLVHIERRYFDPSWIDMTNLNGMNHGKWRVAHPANDDERENDPKVKAKANFRVEWPTSVLPNGQVNKEELKVYVEEFIKFLNR
jgi:hypothetical protein